MELDGSVIYHLAFYYFPGIDPTSHSQSRLDPTFESDCNVGQGPTGVTHACALYQPFYRKQ